MSKINNMSKAEIYRLERRSETQLLTEGYSLEEITEIFERASAFLDNDMRETKEMEEVEKLVETLSRFVNRGGSSKSKKEYFVRAVRREHRTLQQLLFSLFMECIKDWAETKEGHYDLRNEATVKTSKKIMTALPDYYGVPFI